MNSILTKTIISSIGYDDNSFSFSSSPPDFGIFCATFQTSLVALMIIRKLFYPQRRGPERMSDTIVIAKVSVVIAMISSVALPAVGVKIGATTSNPSSPFDGSIHK